MVKRYKVTVTDTVTGEEQELDGDQLIVLAIDDTKQESEFFIDAQGIHIETAINELKAEQMGQIEQSFNHKIH